MTQEEYSEILSQAKDQFKSSISSFGRHEVFRRILESSLYAALEGLVYLSYRNLMESTTDAVDMTVT